MLFGELEKKDSLHFSGNDAYSVKRIIIQPSINDNGMKKE